MSLINEALKKAQRARHDGARAGGAGPEPDGPIVKRAQPRSAKSMLLIVVGAVVLVVISMVLTALWLTRQPSRIATVTNTPSAPAASIAADSGRAPIVVVPVAPAATPGATPAETPAPPPVVAATPAPAKPIVSVVAPAQAAPKPPEESPSPAPTSVAAKPDERIQQFIDALHVTGIRSSGNESKVLMNDRVYRVNDVVDRALAIRLTKVSADSLTFTDANGVTYLKYF